MRRIAHATAEPDLHGAGKAGFTEGEFATQKPPTVLTETWLNDVQEEVATIIEEAGLALDETLRLSAAIKQVIANAQPRNVITPSGLNSAQDAYAPTGWATAGVVRLSGAGGPIRGMVPSTPKLLVNVNAIGENSMVIEHESGSASAANRIASPTEGTIRIAPGESLHVQYDAVTERWRPVLPGRADQTFTRRIPAGRGFKIGDSGTWVPHSLKTGAIENPSSGTWAISLDDVPPGASIVGAAVRYTRTTGTATLQFWRSELDGDYDSPIGTSADLDDSSGLSAYKALPAFTTSLSNSFNYYLGVVQASANDIVIHGFEIMWVRR